ncbi:MAG: DNA replication and repair protein RecF [Paludibacteraceae bacterium]|nr:DNA replication and repair protein RecF [Paludibacteraceae bacterium]
MYLERLRVLNYKNLEEVDLTLSPKINCFIGNNGEGKTNLLDAVYYLSFCKSHSVSVDSQNIMYDKDFFMINGTYILDNQTTDIYCGIKRRQKKQFKRDKKEYDKLSDHIGLLPLVLVSPADEELILGGSEERRKFIDGFIAQYDKKYLSYLLSYKTLLTQRNAMIRNEVRDSLLYDTVEEQMSMYGTYIYEQRTRFISEFMPHFQEFHQNVSMGKESVKLFYRSQMQETDSLMSLMQGSREKDFIVGYTTKGIHKDDLDMTMNDLPIRKVGSQGQNKTYLIALKLAQFDFLMRLKNEKPILLFDDIFDKLDALRVNQIVQLMKDNRFGQVFISDTNREHLSSLLKNIDCDFHIYGVKSGAVELKESK